MRTYINSEIARKYNVSNTAVMNWIQGALQNKNKLQLEKVKNKFKVVRNEHNDAEMLRLSQQARIYKNKIAAVTVCPTEDFYKVFTEDQIIELINDIKLYKKIPLKFTYLSKGAKIWDDFVKESKIKGTYMADVKTPRLLKDTFNFLEEITTGYDRVNLVDLGTGNSESMKIVVEKLKELNKMGKYIGVDISKEMLDISEQNLSEFDKDINYVKTTVDFEEVNTRTSLFKNKRPGGLNLVFFTGGTYGNMENQRRTLENIRCSLDDQDLLILSNKIERDIVKTNFGALSTLRPRYAWIPEMLGINPYECEYDNRYDEEIGGQIAFIRLDKDYTVVFDKLEKQAEINLYKGEELVIWSHIMSTKEDLLDDLKYCKLDLMYLTTTTNMSHMLVIAKVKN